MTRLYDQSITLTLETSHGYYITRLSSYLKLTEQLVRGWALCTNVNDSFQKLS